MYNFTNDKQKIVFYDAFKGFLLDGTICAIQLVFILRKKTNSFLAKNHEYLFECCRAIIDNVITNNIYVSQLITNFPIYFTAEARY